MNQKILSDIISDFGVEKFIRFFREKNRAFAPQREDLLQYDDDNFKNGIKLGEIQFAQDEKMLICAFEASRPLSERSGKKAQYEKGKKILKGCNADAGIFIFYACPRISLSGNTSNNFRFSLIYAEYLGVRRRFSYFKRLTFFVSPRLTNKTFLQQIGEGNFSSFKKIKEAFSVEPVTKQFYGELQYWYFWAMDKIQFPDDYKYSNDPAKDKEIRNATNLIRLITRIIFIWFLTEKGLIPPELFSREKLGRIVKDFIKGKKAYNFYNAILQNLFFGTLNQKMDERRFAQESGFQTHKKEYGVKNLFRYADKFLISKNEVLEFFKNIPFLNGGLFDCLDKEDESDKVIYVDGFSRNRAKQSIIPDYLFFQQDEERADLSKYGLGTSRPVRGLIEILNSYNFTIDENTPIDQEIALDPELLGKVFENLLASYNPETATTARKATGSYYTPREIVDYMVEESLFEYLSSKFPSPSAGEGEGWRHSREGGNPEVKELDARLSLSPQVVSGGTSDMTDNKEQKLRQLLSYSEEIPEFSEPEKQKIISAIDDIKILDPACGSGAFPMGILHKLVFSLQKLDPQNKYWHELQYQKALKESEEVFKQDDKNERQERLKEINETFDEGINYPDYARKLYLIENCIYGVDIQPIAIQISKLRFFISLVLDQKADRAKENFGIRALPNLETKFVAVNTLIGLDRPVQLTFKNPPIKKKEQELKQIRHKYFEAKTRKEKLDYQKKDQQIRKEIAELLEHGGWDTSTAEKIVTFDLYDQNASADWFDPEWMFGITEGFDVVIGNPPYVDSETMTKINPQFRDLLRVLYKSAKGNWDLFVIFIEKGLLLTKMNGSFSYIVPNKLIGAKYTEALREILLSRQFIEIRDYSDVNVFKEADVYPIVFVIQNARPSSYVMMTKMSDVSNCKYTNKIANDIYYKDIYWDRYFEETSLVNLILKISKNDKLSKYFPNVVGAATVNEAYQIKEVLRELDATSKEYKNFINTGTIDKYCSFWGNEKTQYIKKSYYKPIILSSELKIINPSRLLQANSCKIIIAGMAKEIEAFYDEGEYLAGKSTSIILGEPEKLKVLTAILNSKLISFWFACFYHSLAMSGGYFNIGNNEINNIPIANFFQAVNIGFAKIVNQILAAKKNDPNADTSALEKQIDEMVYALYDLTPEEIAIVEGNR